MRHNWIIPAVVLMIAAAGQSFSTTANVTLPSALTFNVTNVNAATTGTPNPCTASYDTELPGSDEVWISIQADAANFTRPGAGGGSIPASSVTWTVVATHGVGPSGTLSNTYNWTVLESESIYTNGSAAVTFTLAAPGTGVRAGTHTLSCTWKVAAL